jgi:hypothetical protein
VTADRESTADPGPPLEAEEVHGQEAVTVPGPEDTSLISTDLTGSVHGDEATAERVGRTEA